MLAAPFCLDEARAPQNLQVTRCVCEAEAGPSGKHFNAPLALSNMLDQFDPVGVTERLGYPGEAGEDLLLGSDA
jgi:hypothetical protein